MIYDLIEYLDELIYGVGETTWPLIGPILDRTWNLIRDT